MKEYKITSEFIRGNTKDSIVPDCYISPNDPMFNEIYNKGVHQNSAMNTITKLNGLSVEVSNKGDIK